MISLKKGAFAFFNDSCGYCSLFLATVSQTKKKENGLDGGTENATSVVPRTLAEIKKKWDDVKIITKKRAVEVERVS